jgi:recombinational DNA repair protein (RecF pathway)
MTNVILPIAFSIYLCKVKKFLAISLLMIYGLSSFGITVNFHYCCGKLKTVKLSNVKTKSCGMEKKMAGKSCCGDKTFELKVKTDYNTQSSYTLSPISSIIIPYSYNNEILNTQYSILNTQYLQPPTLGSPPPLYILHCIYRI